MAENNFRNSGMATPQALTKQQSSHRSAESTYAGALGRVASNSILKDIPTGALSATKVGKLAGKSVDLDALGGDSLDALMNSGKKGR
jgi:hypothetical protein